MAKWHAASMCFDCWVATHNYNPSKLRNVEEKICCYCHKKNEDGIFIRDDAEVLNCEHNK